MHVCVLVGWFTCANTTPRALLSQCDAAELTPPLSDKLKRLRLLLPRRLEAYNQPLESAFAGYDTSAAHRLDMQNSPQLAKLFWLHNLEASLR